MTDLTERRSREEPLRAPGRAAAPPPPAPAGEPLALPPAAAPPDDVVIVVAEDVVVVCPNCSERSALTVARKEADAFCLACDHPLFWIERPGGPDVADDGETDAEVLRRRPGAGGRQRLATEPCPSCAEPNDVRAAFCLRCGAPMDEPPRPPVELPPEVGPVLVVPPARPTVPFWMLVLFALIGLLILVAMVAVVVA